MQLPDGRVQTVIYSVDHNGRSGFNAQVTYSEPNYGKKKQPQKSHPDSLQEVAGLLTKIALVKEMQGEFVPIFHPGLDRSQKHVPRRHQNGQTSYVKLKKFDPSFRPSKRAPAPYHAL